MISSNGWLSLIVGFGYVFWMAVGISLVPKNKPYNRLFNLTTYLGHLACSVVLSSYGLYVCRHIEPRATFFFAPTVFLLLFFIADKVTQSLTGRHVILATRQDFKPTQYVWYIDGILGVFILLGSILIPGFLINYFRWY